MKTKKGTMRSDLWNDVICIFINTSQRVKDNDICMFHMPLLLCWQGNDIPVCPATSYS